MVEGKISNQEFSKSDQLFQRACSIAKTPITARQASKYKSNWGLAFNFKNEAKQELQQEQEEISKS